VEWVTLARNKEQWRAVVNAVMNVKFSLIAGVTIQVIVLDVVPFMLVDINKIRDSLSCRWRQQVPPKQV